jgi:hypothetical protein
MNAIAPVSAKSGTGSDQAGDGLGNNRMTVEQSTPLGSGLEFLRETLAIGIQEGLDGQNSSVTFREPTVDPSTVTAN